LGEKTPSLGNTFLPYIAQDCCPSLNKLKGGEVPRIGIVGDIPVAPLLLLIVACLALGLKSDILCVFSFDLKLHRRYFTAVAHTVPSLVFVGTSVQLSLRLIGT